MKVVVATRVDGKLDISFLKTRRDEGQSSVVRGVTPQDAMAKVAEEVERVKAGRDRGAVM